MSGPRDDVPTRPWLRSVAAIPRRRTWFTLAKVLLVAGASLLGYLAGANSHLGYALGAAACLVVAALVEGLDAAIRDDEQREAETPAGSRRGRTARTPSPTYGQLVNYTLTPIADVIARMLVTPDRQDRAAPCSPACTRSRSRRCATCWRPPRPGRPTTSSSTASSSASSPTAPRRSARRFEPGSGAARADPAADQQRRFRLRPGRAAEPAVKPSPGSAYRSVIAFSVRTDDRPFGMLTVDSPQVDAFSEKDISTVRVLAKLVASARAAVDATVPR